MNYKVSIIIPIYNVEAYIRESLLSALNQTFQSIEYILIDDCSTDHSIEIVQSVLYEHPRGRSVHIYRHEKNSGLSVARNTGMKKATGEYIFFMDSDDEIIPDCIEKHYNAICKNNADFTIANICLVGANSVHIKDFSKDCVNEDLLSSFCLRKWNVSACNKLYSSSFLLKNNLLFQKGLLQEDVLWSYHLCLYSAKAAWIKDKTYIYKVRGGSITRSKNNSQRIESMLFILNSMMDDWKTGTVNSIYRNEFACLINFYRFNTALLLLNFSGNIKQAHYYYNLLKSNHLNSLENNSYYFRLLKLPFFLFLIFIYPPYFVYKLLSK